VTVQYNTQILYNDIVCITHTCVLVCVIFILFRVIPTYSFVDYIRGGCEINLIVAIDFTVRGSRDLRYISIQQYINTISMYHDMILRQANIVILILGRCIC